MLNEGDIKAAVIDKLFASAALSDAVLINEMVIANWSRRADLVVANGKLHAFEIKSDFDSLRRLQGQVETYLSRFDKVTVVCTPKFAQLVRDCTESRVEIWCATSQDDGVRLSVYRRGHATPVSNKRVLYGFLHKSELVALLKSEDRDANADMSRSQLEEQADVLSTRRIKEFVLDALKKRYRESFERFCDIRRGRTQPVDLMKLSKFKAWQKPIEFQAAQLGDCASLNAKTLDLKALAGKYGPLPADMPTFVRRRT
ncbi:sce7726 family protein [Massilia solisilvae]|uniref:Sce7726 family protein n=1 Tax=Massilia solisilvae TaxID=1811225 RepID=A0ABT2BNT9_9BURK|nr:sce7726 family protein [Massilia solisilvae]